MTSFIRELDLLDLVGRYINSPFLASILKRVGAVSTSYEVEITHYAPAVAGRYHGKPEDCYPDEPEELEFEPMFNLQTYGMYSWALICEKVKKEKSFFSRNFYLLMLNLYKENIVEAFVEHEEAWLESKEAYEEIKRSAEDDF